MTGQAELAPTLLIGRTPRMLEIGQLVEKAGKTRWPVLLLGETGTGKEVVARSIHNIQNLGEFVTIDCSSLVGPLMESELFGHVKGSFTGAVGNKTGLLETADGGTAFFDEIGELPLDMQAKLLRVLQEKEFRPVGSLVQKKSDFRVIAATNRDLSAEVEKGTFRADLFYRLKVVSIRLIPLRERKEDIPLLVAHFLERCGVNYTVTAEAMDALMSYDWPGNVRELEHCIQHMVALNSGPLLHLAGLPSMVQNHMRQQRQTFRTMGVGAGGAEQSHFAVQDQALGLEMPMRLTDMEKHAIVHALQYTQGDRAVAAHVLGIGRTTLYRKIKEYQLQV